MTKVTAGQLQSQELDPACQCHVLFSLYSSQNGTSRNRDSSPPKIWHFPSEHFVLPLFLVQIFGLGKRPSSLAAWDNVHDGAVCSQWHEQGGQGLLLGLSAQAEGGGGGGGGASVGMST